MQLKLEKLLAGKGNSIEIRTEPDISRQELLDEINYFLLSSYPGCKAKGNFLDFEGKDYLIYELHVSDNKSSCVCSIRLIEFPEAFKIIRLNS